MSKVDKKLTAAKCTINSAKDFERSPNVVSVVRVHDEVEVTFKRNDGKHIFPTMYGRSDNYPFKDCLITAKLLEPKDSDNSLKNLYNKFIRDSEVD